MFGFSGRAGGEIAHYGLSTWWKNDFTDEERSLIREKCMQGTMGVEPIDRGAFSGSNNGTALRLMDRIGRAITKKEYALLGAKVYAKGDALIDDAPKILDVHFYLFGKIGFFYRCRDELPNGLKIAVNAIQSSIALSERAKAEFKKQKMWSGKSPSHTGYRQLAILYEKDKQFDVAVTICKRAKKQGWSGDWDKRIDRCTQRMKKAAKKT